MPSSRYSPDGCLLRSVLQGAFGQEPVEADLLDTRIGGQSSGGEDRLVQNAAGRLIAVALRPYELVKVAIVAKELGKDNEYLARA